MSAARSRRPLIAIVCLLGVAMGLACIVAGLAWSSVATPESVWSPEQAAEFKAASSAVHAASIQGEAAAAAARERFDRVNAELEAARYARDHWGLWIAGCGLGLTLASGLGYLAARDE